MWVSYSYDANPESADADSTDSKATERAGSKEKVKRCQFSLSEMSIFNSSSLCLVSVETIYLRVLRRS